MGTEEAWLIVDIFYSRSRQMNVISARRAHGCYERNAKFNLMAFSNKNLRGPGPFRSDPGSIRARLEFAFPLSNYLSEF